MRRNNQNILQRIIYVFKQYRKGNNSIIPLETRLVYQFFKVSWYYEDSFYYKKIGSPFVSIFRLPILLLTKVLIEFFGMKYKEFKWGLRWIGRDQKI